MSESPLELLLRHAYGFWGSAILAAAFKHRVFTHLFEGACTPHELAAGASISLRGSQAILDGLVGLRLIEKKVAGYEISPQLVRFLLPNSSEYIGGYADVILSTLADWSRLPDAIASGQPVHRQERADPHNSFWSNMVRAVAPLGFAPARAAAERLCVVDRSDFSMLDVGGGSGAYCAVWLGMHPNGLCTQLDWPNVNAIAREYVAGFGHADRFETIDGDMERIELAPESFDYVVYANVAHGLSVDRNVAMLRRLRSWLKADGTLIIVGLIPDDDRSGSPLVLMASSNLLLNTEEGAIYVRSDYHAWLTTCGYSAIQFDSVTGLPFTLVYASR
jgi:hypothetical protein